MVNVTANARRLLPSERPLLPFDAAMMVSLISVGCVGLSLALGGLFIAGWAAALGIAVGAILATVNLWLFAYIGRGVLAGGSRSRLYGLLAALKFFALLGVAFLLIRSQLTSGLMLAISNYILYVAIRRGPQAKPTLVSEFPEYCSLITRSSLRA